VRSRGGNVKGQYIEGRRGLGPDKQIVAEEFVRYSWLGEPKRTSAQGTRLTAYRVKVDSKPVGIVFQLEDPSEPIRYSNSLPIRWLWTDDTTHRAALPMNMDGIEKSSMRTRREAATMLLLDIAERAQ
jgi:hypothetical protein